MKEHYINATIEMIQSGADVATVLTGLEKAMKAKGHLKLLPAVLRGVIRILETKSDTLGATVIVARAGDIQKLTATIQKALSEIDTATDYKTVVDATLIGGAVVKSNNRVVDVSYKSALTKLYRAVTK